ncbi:MAG: biotin carboxylase N-terminal domain-containing protein, partial [Acidimicrobiia bacterium]
MAVFSKILIANRSEIARRIIRTCSEMGIATVAVFSEYDTDALFVHDADEAVALLPGSSYLDGSSIIESALRTGAAAIHPGYGFLSENAEFAGAVEAAGLTFIGPAPETIGAMGSKLESRELMQTAGVPVLAVAELPDGLDAVEAAAVLGYPLLVKASRGGGGRGMRIVAEPDGLAEAIESGAREAESAFGDGTVYLERFVSNPRHIEVQIVGDGEGHVVHLYERECSIQRRFQKVIEETPSPDLDTELRRRLWDAAVKAGEAVSYRGAGTVEFIVDPSGDFAFLEMNTRIQ